MSATDLLIWGIAVHLVCDWLLQNEWMAVNKMKRRIPDQRQALLRWIRNEAFLIFNSHWWDRHPAAYAHAGIHTAGLLLVFPWPAAIALGLSHLLIDCRSLVAWWSRLIRQTQPGGQLVEVYVADLPDEISAQVPNFDIGADVRIWVDQVWHIAALAIAALVIGGGG